MEFRVQAVAAMLLAPAIFAEVGETEVAGAIVYKAKAVRHRALFIILELLVLEAFLHLLPQPNCKRGHGSFIVVLDCAWALRNGTLEDVSLLQTVIGVLVKALKANLVVPAREEAFAVGLDCLLFTDGANTV